MFVHHVIRLRISLSMGNIDSLPAVQLTSKEGKNNADSITDVCLKLAMLGAVATRWNREILISFNRREYCTYNRAQGCRDNEAPAG